MSKKSRLDELMVERGLAADLDEARRLVWAGCVRTETKIVDKPGTRLSRGAPLEVDRPPEFASRAGEKLEGALHDLAFDVSGASCADLGCGAGGFTQSLLKHGAARVYAIDVAYGQLAWSVRSDPRVVTLERTHVRDVLPEHVGGGVDVVVADLSFIGLSAVLGKIASLLRPGGSALLLVKPQFELARGEVPDGGVVTDESKRIEAVARVAEEAERWGLTEPASHPSRVAGRKGNVEWFLKLTASAGELLFVYGSLRRGQRYQTELEGASYLRPARTRAELTLHDLGEYPALMEGGSTSISGELYRLSRAQLDAIDRFEDHPRLFRRAKLQLEDGTRAWAYFGVAAEIRSHPVVAHGDWARRSE
jgi:23S rRNA (cytidine1920-2'-O)/16S rRNA (cytidine1409-2'-O)-methyltransferase